MKNSINGSKEQTKETPKNSGINSTIRTIILALTLTLSAAACSTPVEKIQKQEEKINKLTSEYLVKTDHYEEISRQQNIQIDLEEEGADPSINQEIGYSTNQLKKYDEDISKTKKKLDKAQKKLHKLEEKYPDAATSRVTKHTRSNPKKYKYIREQYRRAAKK